MSRSDVNCKTSVPVVSGSLGPLSSSSKTFSIKYKRRIFNAIRDKIPQTHPQQNFGKLQQIISDVDNGAYCVCTHDFSLCTHKNSDLCIPCTQ